MASAPRKAAVAAASVVLVLLVLEAAASLLLAWRDAPGHGISEERHCVYDADLGWSHRRSVRVADLYGPGRDLTTNARGFRALEEYTGAVPEGRARVVCLGDSFTLGHGVGDRSTWPAKLEELEPRIQAVNMGQGGYGVDQCYLWYLRDGVALDADAVVLAYIAPDFERMLSSRFQGEYPKPVLRARDGELEVTNVPVPDEWGGSPLGSARRVLARTALVRVLERVRARVAGPPAAPARGPGDFAWAEVARLVLADLARASRERGAELVLVQIPLRDPTDGDAPAVAAFVARETGRLGVPFVDLAPRFAALSPGEARDLYLPDGHLDAQGNAFVARAILDELRARLPAFP